MVALPHLVVVVSDGHSVGVDGGSSVMTRAASGVTLTGAGHVPFVTRTPLSRPWTAGH